MQMKLTLLRNDPARLAHWQHQAHLAAQRYSKEHLAQVWHDFYYQQAQEEKQEELERNGHWRFGCRLRPCPPNTYTGKR